MNPSKQLNYQTWLREEFVARCRKNPAYSVRAFAKLLGTDSSSLSQILAGKRNASVKLVTRFANVIGAAPEVRQAIIEDARRRQKRSFRSSADVEIYQELAVDVFSLMADWYHYAILDLSRIAGFKSEARWIARKLNLTAAEVQIAIERLLRLGLLQEVDGRFVATNKKLTNAGFVATSDAMKKLQRHVVAMGLEGHRPNPAREKRHHVNDHGDRRKQTAARA